MQDVKITSCTLQISGLIRYDMMDYINVRQKADD